mgnify:CR=1 FL=1
MKALLYCTKNKPYLVKDAYLVKDGGKYFTGVAWQLRKWSLNGKIVAECDYEVEEIIANDVNLYDEYGIKYTTKNGYSGIDDNFEALLNDSCLNAFELNDYLGGYGGYAIHIKNLHIFDKPRDLSYYHNAEDIMCVLTNAPQNMMYCYDYKGMERKTSFYKDIFEKKVLIPIHPEQLCKKLNGESTIIVKKNVLKEML